MVKSLLAIKTLIKALIMKTSNLLFLMGIVFFASLQAESPRAGQVIDAQTQTESSFGSEEVSKNEIRVAVIKLPEIIAESSKIREKITSISTINADVVLLEIDCKGGIVGSCELILEELKKIKKQVPIVAVVENYCASGGYLIASVANKIIAPESSSIGSIGVICMETADEIVLKKMDSMIHSGKYKVANSQSKDSEVRARMQSTCDKAYEIFVSTVAKHRDALKVENHKDWADGKLFLGKEALELGLIDEIGGFPQVEEEIFQLTDSDPNKTSVKYLNPTKDYETEIISWK
jgi:protease-4